MQKETFDRSLGKLTKQEEKVLRLFLEGKDDRAIAEVLSCTQENVRSHLANICRKLTLTENVDSRGCSHRDELITLCFKFKPEWVAPPARKRVGYPSLEYPNGRVPLESYFYLSRNNIEQHCSQAILESGALIRIKAPKLMGKTSLMSRIFAEAKKEVEIRTVEATYCHSNWLGFWHSHCH